jgi:type II secretory ATPase GspE/PulE/Tfp pilus assembly ATPase PilB-like protein
VLSAASAEEQSVLARGYGEDEFRQLAAVASGRISLRRPRGCAACKQTGYRGRVAIHELLIASDEIKSMIVVRQRIPEILAQARREGMTTLVQDGIVKVLDGITDYRQIKSAAIR